MLEMTTTCVVLYRLYTKQSPSILVLELDRVGQLVLVLADIYTYVYPFVNTNQWGEIDEKNQARFELLAISRFLCARVYQYVSSHEDRPTQRYIRICVSVCCFRARINYLDAYEQLLRTVRDRNQAAFSLIPIPMHMNNQFTCANKNNLLTIILPTPWNGNLTFSWITIISNVSYKLIWAQMTPHALACRSEGNKHHLL